MPRPPYFVATRPTGTIDDPSPTIGFTLNRPIVLERLRIWIDGNRVDADVRQRDPASFAFDSPWRLSRGPHRVRVSGVTENGSTFDLSWSFDRE